MSSPVMRRAAAAALAGLLIALSACSGGSDAPDGSSSGSSALPGTPVEGESIDTESAYPGGVPTSISLTDPGSNLGLGDTAKVAFTPRRGSVAVISVKVTKIEHTSFKTSFQGWQLSNVKGKSPYFVHAKVTNIGKEVIAADALVPLYALDDVNTLVMYSTFGGTFAPCSPGAFPEKFEPGQKANLCLVYLVPDRGTLLAVAFRHDDLFDPITWSGKIEELTSPSSPGTKSGTSEKRKNP
ncbi:hypothetical protein BH09ACT11_BH09ACT11_11210 [soil metagenome]